MSYREIADQDGAVWAVWDTHPESARHAAVAAFASGWLTFQSATERRRLVPAPDDWVLAPEERLRQWLALATPVRLTLEPADDLPIPRRRPEAEGSPDESAARTPRYGSDETRAAIERSRGVLQEMLRAIERGSETADDRPVRDDRPPNDRRR